MGLSVVLFTIFKIKTLPLTQEGKIEKKHTTINNIEKDTKLQ